ncbi:MAG: valyl-tRNA synthetase [Candidatus Berkelbacteria bacterium Licking1014_7]|uniref:Valine--tRNA ligase n=1 Tax=Candidatus Berkelbacteria bacterium Licking1014_7 TaxID=2017147 RepID=A0A554LK68_9BACT|nr:MAG: valyl-tRNA synthetase [Candidatus Berkelbacteria bacterium Licking1014_7]
MLVKRFLVKIRIMELEKKYDPSKVEKKVYQKWEQAEVFKPKGGKGKKSFSIAIPPPNITGSLHLGHALNNTAQDILIRFHRMKGDETIWIPGTDHAGIATQNVVEKDLRKNGKSRFDLGRENFEKRVWQWKDEYGGKILDQLKKMGCSVDWSRLAFTMDENYIKAVRQTFAHYYKKGWIYQGERVVNWCPRCASSLSDLEVESKEKAGKLYFVKYFFKNQKSKIKNQNGISKIKNAESISVATTRPETMLGDSAVAVNPQDARYKNLVGRKLILPLAGREIEIIANSEVQMPFGTGAVKITPAHSFSDFEIGQRHNLAKIKVIDKDGKMFGDIPKKYQGLDRFQARKEIVKDLRSQGFLEKVEDYEIILPLCSRCDSVVEPILSQQWFLKMDCLKKPALEAIKSGKIKFYPVRYKKICYDWLEKAYDWCISRQLWWGHRLPVWQTKSKIKNQKSKILDLKIENCDKNIYVGLTPPPGEGWTQSEDVLDTWFSSALWTFVTLGWQRPGDKNKDLEKFHPTSVLSTARDIIFLWVGRMIFSSLELTGEIPFRKVYIHPIVLSEKGQRMSKSLGTGIDPLDLIQTYGADAVRFGLMYQNMGGQDLRFSESHIVASRNFCNKLWNIARFIGINLETSKIKNQKSKTHIKIQKEGTKNDKEILRKLAEIEKQVAKDIDGFRFGKATHLLYDFVWRDLADNYLGQAREQMQVEKTKESTQAILLFTLIKILKILHPFMPFITEEIWSKLYDEGLVDEEILAIS